MMKVAETIRKKLENAFSPTHLEIIDDSHKHAGHKGARPEGETHFTVVITSDAFKGINRVQRHRMINTILADELKERVHALSLRVMTAEE